MPRLLLNAAIVSRRHNRHYQKDHGDSLTSAMIVRLRFLSFFVGFVSISYNNLLLLPDLKRRY